MAPLALTEAHSTYVRATARQQSAWSVQSSGAQRKDVGDGPWTEFAQGKQTGLVA